MSDLELPNFLLGWSAIEIASTVLDGEPLSQGGHMDPPLRLWKPRGQQTVWKSTFPAFCHSERSEESRFQAIWDPSLRSGWHFSHSLTGPVAFFDIHWEIILTGSYTSPPGSCCVSSISYYQPLVLTCCCVFCKYFLEKVANSFSIVLQLHFPHYCK